MDGEGAGTIGDRRRVVGHLKRKAIKKILPNMFFSSLRLQMMARDAIVYSEILIFALGIEKSALIVRGGEGY